VVADTGVGVGFGGGVGVGAALAHRGRNRRTARRVAAGGHMRRERIEKRHRFNLLHISPPFPPRLFIESPPLCCSFRIMNRLRIGVIGASGYVGRQLGKIAAASGHAVIPFSRSIRPGYRLLPSEGRVDLSGLDAVVNLAGEPILGLWTKSKRRNIRESRVFGTAHLVESMLSASGGPRILLNASAVGFYGDTGEEEVTENSAAGTGFLAETCQAWEAATQPAARAGLRVVRLRIGFVVGPGGAMNLILPVFRWGLGGNLGNGRQWMSCIHVDDVAGMALWCLENETLSGPVNAVMPEPVRNAVFTRELSAAVHRPAILPAPAFALRLMLGELSRVMLDSVRVRPLIAESLRYKFHFPTLPAAFASLQK